MIAILRALIAAVEFKWWWDDNQRAERGAGEISARDIGLRAQFQYQTDESGDRISL